MKPRVFREILEPRLQLPTSVCVGLDSDYTQIPTCVRRESVEDTIFDFNRAIIEATHDFVCAYKPNIAFYEAYGTQGITALIRTIKYLNEYRREIPVILDAKRADIGNTNKGYAKFAFHILGADAITVNPYLGQEALQPFLEYKNKGIFVLCRTSNPRAGEFQDLLFNGIPLYQVVAQHVATEWNTHNNCGLVVGATYPNELREVRNIVGNMPILIPGIGAQDADLGEAVTAGLDNRGYGIVANASRSIIFASKGPDFADAARKKTQTLSAAINHYRAALSR